MNTFFDQRGQNVTYQYNAANDINFNNVKNTADFTTELKKLQDELKKAIEHNTLSEDAADDATYHMKKAVNETQKTNPQKTSIRNHLSKAKEAVTTSATLLNLAKGIDWAITQIP